MFEQLLKNCKEESCYLKKKLKENVEKLRGDFRDVIGKFRVDFEKI